MKKNHLLIAIFSLVFVLITSLSLSACGKKKPKTTTEHTHSFSTEWSNDASNHWHACSDCTEKKDNEAHTFVWVIDEDATYKELGSKHEHCSVCGYDKAAIEIEKLPKENPSYTVPTGLTATYGETLADVTLPTGFTFEDALTTSVGAAGSNTFTVKYTKPNDDIEKYNVITGITVAIEVSKASSSVNNFFIASKKYDGLAVENPTFEKVGNGDVVIEWYQGTTKLPSAPINIGSYNVKVIVAENENYLSSFAERTFTISKNNCALLGAKVTKKTYDGIGVDSDDITGILGDGTVSYIWRKNGVMVKDIIDAGSYTVDISYTNATNYINANRTLNFTIEKAESSITTVPTQSSDNFVGQTLAAVSLIGGAGSLSGTFAFADETVVIDSTSKEYEVTFTPIDTNYKASTANVLIDAEQLKIGVNAGANGAIYINNVKVSNGEYNVNYESNYTFSFVPDSGETNYTVNQIKIDNDALSGEDLVSAISNGYVVNSITSVFTIEVTFKVASSSYNLTLNIVTPLGGTVTFDGEDTSGFTLTPKSYGSHNIGWTVKWDYYLKSLTIGGIKVVENKNIDGNKGFNLTSDTVVTVEFALYDRGISINTYNAYSTFPSTDKITYEGLDDGTKTRLISVPNGSNKDITFTLEEGYIITDIQIYDVYIDDTALALANSSKKITFDNINADIDVSFYIGPVSTTIMIVKSTLDDDAATEFEDLTFFTDGYTNYYTKQIPVTLFIPKGYGLHIYKDDETVDLFDTFITDYDESVSKEYYMEIPFGIVDAKYEFEFYTRYVELTFTISGNGDLAKGLLPDETYNIIVPPYNVIKYIDNDISIIPADGYYISLFKVNEVEAEYSFGWANDIQTYYYRIDNPTTDININVTFEEITYKATVTGYDDEYFDYFEVYSIVPGGTEGLKTKDTDGNYIFVYGEKISKYKFIFNEKYAWDESTIDINGNASAYFCGNDSEEYTFSTPKEITSDFAITVTADIAKYRLELVTSDTESVKIKVDDVLINTGYSSNNYYSVVNNEEYCIPYGSTVKLTVTPKTGYEYRDGLTFNDDVLCIANTDGKIIYEYIAKDSKMFFANCYAKTIVLDLTVQLDNNDGTLTEISSENWGTYLNTDDGYCLNYFYKPGVLTFEYDSTNERYLKVKQGYYITKFIFQDVV